MPRENAHDKGRRLLVEGRLHVRAVTERHITATCRGDSGEVYLLCADDRSWTCSCPAASRCAHLIALMLVTLKPLTLTGTGKEGIK